jgi:hypothetical protein
MPADVTQAYRLRLVNEQTQDTSSGRQVADGAVLSDGHPISDELHQAAVRADDAQRTEPGVSDLASGNDDP